MSVLINISTHNFSQQTLTESSNYPNSPTISKMTSFLTLLLTLLTILLSISHGLVPAQNPHSSKSLCPCIETDPSSLCYDITDHEQGTCTSRPCNPSYECVEPSQASHYCVERTMKSLHVKEVMTGVCREIWSSVTIRTPYSEIQQPRPWSLSHAHRTNCIFDDLHLLEPQPCGKTKKHPPFKQRVSTQQELVPAYAKMMEHYFCKAH